MLIVLEAVFGLEAGGALVLLAAEMNGAVSPF
jgi:hypothetical protein